jgi:lysophospholipase L1-like esterase
MSRNLTSKKSRGKRLLQKLGLAGGSVLVFLLLFEIVLRFCGYGNLEIYQPDTKLYWKLKPNQDCFTKVDHKPVHVNAHGMRGGEFAAVKPEGTFRILSLGDSRTFGWGLADEETYSRRLEKLLRTHAGNDRHVEVINAGVNAWSFAQMDVFFRDAAREFQPDMVILAEANLWTQFSEKNSPEFVQKFMSRVRLKNLLRRSAIYHFLIEVKLAAFYARYRTKFIPVDPKQDELFKEQQQNDPDAVFRDAIADVCRTARSNNIQPVLLFLPMLEDLRGTNQSRVLRAKQTVAAELNVPLSDVTRDITPDGKALYLEADPVHFNARGNEIIAQRLFETVTNFVAR